MKDYDILIIGAGVVGISLVLALSHLPLRIALVEQTSFQQEEDTAVSTVASKPIALNYASIRILQALIPGPTLSDHTNPIETVHISEQGCFAAARIRAKEMGVPALGYIIPAAQLGKACIAALVQLTQEENTKKRRLDLFNPAQCHTLTRHQGNWEALITTHQDNKSLKLHARLLIVADGSDSVLRNHLMIGIQEKNEGQKALVTTLSLVRHHGHTAYQRFTRSGIVACLPLVGNTVGLAWTATHALIEELLLLTDFDFLARLQTVFSYRLGPLLQISQRRAYPLKSVTAELQAKPGLILLGNAAHTLSPIAAQGLNLALQDMAVLADILAAAVHVHRDLADPSLNQAYLAARSSVQKQLIGFTEHLASLFEQKFTPLTLVRNNGLLAFDLVSPVKKNISRRLMGIHGRLPALVRCLAGQ